MPCLICDMNEKSTMDLVVIGKIVNVVGLKGAVKVQNYSDEPDRFETIEKVYIENNQYKITHVRYQKAMVILQLDKVETRNDAEKLRGKEIAMAAEDLWELPEGQYYIRDLLGSKVLLEDNSLLGTLEEIKTDTSQDLYCIKTLQGNIVYLPGVKEFVRNIDLEERQIIVRVPDGLLEL